MDNKRYKTTIALVIVLMLLAVGLFIFDNFYLTKIERANFVGVYVAKDDIQAYTKLSKDMFKKVNINKDSVLPVYVTKLEEFENKELKGAVLKGEPLSKVRIGEIETDKGEFSLKIVPDHIGDLSKEDIVNIYVQLIDPYTKESNIKLLLEKKKVKKLTSPDNIILTDLQQGVRVANVYVDVNEKELKDYYIAKENGYIIVVKHNKIDVDKVERTNEISFDKEIDKFDARSQEAINSKRILNTDSDEGMAVMSYVVQEGETADKLSIKFKTNNSVLSELNHGKIEFKTGDTITVPAE